MKYIFADFEMHPIDKEYIEERKVCRSEIIEFGAVMLDEQYNEITSFKEYVKPQYVRQMYRRVIALTGITDSMLSGARYFDEVFKSFLSWCSSCGEEYMVCAWSESDLKQLIEEMKLKNIIRTESIERLLSCWVDFQKEYCEMVQSEQKLSLDKALSVIGQPYLGRMHDALWDARNTAELFLASRNSEEFFKQLRIIADTVNNARRDIVTFSLGEIFNFDMCRPVLA